MQQPDSAGCYLYCVIPANGPKEFGKIGIGGRGDQVYTIGCKDIAAVVSNTFEEKFESSEENILSHQRVVQRVFEKQLGVPLPFGTVLRGKGEVQQHLEDRYAEFKDKLTKLGNLSADSTDFEETQVGTRQILEEALTQSAASAVRIRQLNEEISQLRTMRYEKTMEAAAEVMMKRLSEHLTSTIGSLSDAIEGLQQKLESLQASVSQTNKTSYEGKFGPDKFPSVDHEIRILREEMERLNRRGIEDMLVRAVTPGSRRSGAS